MAETVGAENIEFTADGKKYRASLMYFTDKKTEIIRVYYSNGETSSLIWKHDDAVPFDYTIDSIVIEADNDNSVWNVKVYRNYDASTQTGTDITSSVDKFTVTIYAVERERTTDSDGNVVVNDVNTKIYSQQAPNDLVSSVNTVDLVDVLDYTKRGTGIYRLDLSNVKSRASGDLLRKEGSSSSLYLYYQNPLVFVHDTDTEYLLVEYVPKETITLTSIGMGVDKIYTSGGTTVGIMHESGIFIYKSSNTPTFTVGDKYAAPYYVATHTITSSSALQLHANETYYIWLRPCTYSSSESQYYYFNNQTGNYKLTDDLNAWQSVQDISDYTYKKTQSVPYDNSFEKMDFFKYTGTSAYIEGVSVQSGNLYYVNRKVYFYGNVSTLPSGTISEASLCYNTSNSTWYCYYPGSGWKAGYQGNTYQPIKQFSTSPSSLIDLDTQTDRKYYLEINGEEV